MIAALTYVPQLVGAFIHLFVARLLEILKDRRKIIVATSFIHAILWIPLLLIPYLNPNQKFLLIVYVSIQTMVVQIMQPIGNSLLGDIVPAHERGRFFGLRNRVTGAVSFVAALTAGLTLNYMSPKHPFLGFTILFSIAFVTRAISGVFKSMLANPEPDLAHAEKFSIVDFVKRMDKTNYGHFVIYIVLFKFATYIAAPFFAVYMLKNLHFTYLQFTIFIAAELIASFIAMGIWGKVIDEKGTKYVLYIGGMLTPLIPFMWLFSTNFYYLLITELFSGFVWAAFNLSASNFIFDAVKPENRVRCIAYYKFFEGIAIFIGAAIGGFLIDKLPAWIFATSILLVFLISGILRLAVSLVLLPTLKEARLIEMGVGHSFFRRFITIRPSEGLLFDVLGRYHKVKEKIMQAKDRVIGKKQKTADKKEQEIYAKKVVKFVEKNISQKKERHELENIHDIEHITEDIEKGKIRK
jgi:MFS family permease